MSQDGPNPWIRSTDWTPATPAPLQRKRLPKSKRPDPAKRLASMRAERKRKRPETLHPYIEEIMSMTDQQWQMLALKAVSWAIVNTFPSS